ncbi:low affinity high capacity ammonium permease [Saitoella coloradoensis]
MSYPYIGTPEYTGTGPNGGDSLTTNLNQWYDRGDMAYILISTAMVWFMIPGIGFFYSGLARRKSALSLIWLCIMSCAVVSFQWYFWGYSLAFSPTGTSGFIGDLHHFAFQNVLATPSPGSALIPTLIYANFQLMFAGVTVALVIGAAAERGRMWPAMVFCFIWTTIVYCPVAYWIWNPNGWAFKWGVLDYAGGGPVEVGSGMGALAYSWVLGKRRGSTQASLNYRPHNVTYVVLGTAFLWFGWFGFNGGSAFGANLRAAMACTITNLAGACGGITWVLLDYRLERKWSVVGFCSGVVAGLVASTPASGFVTVHAGVIIGVVSGAACNYATKLKYLMRIDDALDVFAEHGMGGIVGNILVAFFATDYDTALDGILAGDAAIAGGWFNHNYRQLGLQVAYTLVVAAYVFIVTSLILFIMDRFIPSLSLRASEEAEIKGIDEDQIGEFAYDYVEVRRDYMTWGDPVPQSTVEGQEAPEGTAGLGNVTGPNGLVSGKLVKFNQPYQGDNGDSGASVDGGSGASQPPGARDPALNATGSGSGAAAPTGPAPGYVSRQPSLRTREDDIEMEVIDGEGTGDLEQGHGEGHHHPGFSRDVGESARHGGSSGAFT